MEDAPILYTALAEALDRDLAPIREAYRLFLGSEPMQQFRALLDVAYPMPAPRPAYTRHGPRWRPGYAYLLKRKAVRQQLLRMSEPPEPAL